MLQKEYETIVALKMDVAPLQNVKDGATITSAIQESETKLLIPCWVSSDLVFWGFLISANRPSQNLGWYQR